MITKAKKLQYTVSDGTTCESIDEAKRRELLLLADNLTPDDETNRSILALVAKPREAIAILKFGLLRKARAVKPPMGRKPRRNLKREMPEIPGV